MADSRAGLVGLAVGGGVAALALVAGVVFALRACSGGGPAPAATTPGGEGAQAAREGLHALGTDALRSLGCTTALVMDMARALGDAAVREGEPRYIVTCDVATGATPSCDRAASAYFAALGGGAGGSVNVRVSLQGTARPVCSHLYLPSGADLGEYPRLK
jgi:hypothetical protein